MSFWGFDSFKNTREGEMSSWTSGSKSKRGTSWMVIGEWARHGVARGDRAGGAEGTGGIRLVRDMSQDHFPPQFKDEKKVMMVGTMIGEGPESVREMQRYPRDRDSPRQLTGIRLTSDIK